MPTQFSSSAGTVRGLTRAALCTACACLLAPVSIPIGPVSLTLGVFAILLAGALLPPALAALSACAYLLLGFAGLPVFAGFAAGMGLAMLLQSSTAASLLVASLQAGGLVSTAAALAAVLGADLGSAVSSEDVVYLVGDQESGIDRLPPLCPRVVLAAAKQADLALELVLHGKGKGN